MYVEFIGTLMIVYAWLSTNANPYVMIFAYAATTLVGGGAHNPVITGAEWALGRKSWREAARDALAQLAGAAVAVVGTPVFDLSGRPTE